MRTIDGATDAEVFRAYVEQVLRPTLRPGDIVLMDDLQAHKAAGIREAIAQTRARLQYLPPYSPDLSPIERCWSKLKTALRTAKARTREALEQAIAQALVTITARDFPRLKSSLTSPPSLTVRAVNNSSPGRAKQE